MNFLVVTGGVGCGKSSVCAAIRGFVGGEHCVSFSADAVVAEAYHSPLLRSRIARAVELTESSETMATDAFRRLVRGAVLSSAHKRKRLEGVLHPLVWEALRHIRAKSLSDGVKVLVAEIPLYYETGEPVLADTVVVVAASWVTQLHRLLSRRSLDQKTAEAMLSLQMTLEEKIERSDVVIWNDGSGDALNAQVWTLLQRDKIESLYYGRNY